MTEAKVTKQQQNTLPFPERNSIVIQLLEKHNQAIAALGKVNIELVALSRLKELTELAKQCEKLNEAILQYNKLTNSLKAQPFLFPLELANNHGVVIYESIHPFINL